MEMEAPFDGLLVRFLSSDFWRRHDHFRRFPKKSEVFRRSPKTSEDVRSLPKAKLSSPSLRTRINVSLLPVLFTSKIRDREEGIVIYSFTHGFRSLHGSELTYFWKLCQARRQQLTFFNQAWDAGWKLRSHAGSRLRANFSRLIEKCELLLSCLTEFPKIC